MSSDSPDSLSSESFEAALERAATDFSAEYRADISMVKRVHPGARLSNIDDAALVREVSFAKGARWARQHTLQSEPVRGLVEALRELRKTIREQREALEPNLGKQLPTEDA